MGIGNLFLPCLKVSADAAGSLPRKDKSHFAGRGSSADKRQGSFGVSHPRGEQRGAPTLEPADWSGNPHARCRSRPNAVGRLEHRQSHQASLAG